MPVCEADRPRLTVTVLSAVTYGAKGYHRFTASHLLHEKLNRLTSTA